MLSGAQCRVGRMKPSAHGDERADSLLPTRHFNPQPPCSLIVSSCLLSQESFKNSRKASLCQAHTPSTSSLLVNTFQYLTELKHLYVPEIQMRSNTLYMTALRDACAPLHLGESKPLLSYSGHSCGLQHIFSHHSWALRWASCLNTAASVGVFLHLKKRVDWLGVGEGGK